MRVIVIARSEATNQSRRPFKYNELLRFARNDEPRAHLLHELIGEQFVDR